MASRPQEQLNMALVSAIVAVATIGGLLFGYDSGAVNGTQTGLKAAFALDDNGLGFTVGSLLMGCAAGAFLAGRLADRFGRKRIMVLAAILFLTGALVQGLTADHTLFVIARFFGGMAVGAASVLSPAYISEVAPAAVRGRLTSVQQVMIITGLSGVIPMLEHQPIQSTGFRNIGPVGARTGFAVRVRIPNYHGTRLSQLDGFTVTVDGEVFPFEQNRLGIRGEVYTLAQLREETTARWGLLEWGEILVDKPGGLEPGIHHVEVLARIRYSYFPPDVHVFPMHEARMATLCVA